MKNISMFISHNHVDDEYIDLIRSISNNPNHKLIFMDKSLKYPVYNEHGHVIRCPPSDERSKPVKKEIICLLKTTNKLLVLIGNDTHSKEWVSWEIKVFVSMHGWDNVLLMKTPDNIRGGKPQIAKYLELHDWNIKLLTDWIFS